uniref:Uncharacterized protein n=1 Tax=Meloidogyne enterolobii TaxID=390850 RepID=A0A6V7Y1G7_MELEN|nr:unnamed protein product [Meloidogyne enterolobii]
MSNTNSASSLSPMRWVVNQDARNCSGIMCPPDTLCLRPEHFSVPTHCVHKSVMDNVAKHLSNGPVYLCNDGIVQNIIVGMLVVIIIAQARKLEKMRLYLSYRFIIRSIGVCVQSSSYMPI